MGREREERRRERGDKRILKHVGVCLFWLKRKRRKKKKKKSKRGDDVVGLEKKRSKEGAQREANKGKSCFYLINCLSAFVDIPKKRIPFMRRKRKTTIRLKHNKLTPNK